MIREFILGAAGALVLSSAALAQPAAGGASPGATEAGVAGGVQPYRPAGASGSGLRTPNLSTGTYNGQASTGCVATVAAPCAKIPARGNVVTSTLGGVPGLVGGTVGGALGNGASLIGGTVGGALGVDRKPRPEETPSRP